MPLIVFMILSSASIKMKAAVAVALLLAVAVTSEEKTFTTLKDFARNHYYSSLKERIVGGQVAASAEFPWQVAVYYRNSAGSLYFCGGSLVSYHYVLTAAHCAADAIEFSLYVGSSRLNSNEGTVTVDVSASEATIHPDYNSSTLNNDIALIRLPNVLDETDSIKAIRLPQNGEIISVGTELVVSGWGVTENSTSIVQDLRFTTVFSISNLQCAAVFGSSVVVDSTVCTLGSPLESPCGGDSGGPLVSFLGPEPTLVGVISFIHRDGCQSGYPAGYVRVERQLAFIDTIIAEPGLRRN